MTFSKDHPPKLSSTLLVFSLDQDDDPSILMLRRSPQSRFLPGAWVFPGGAVEVQDIEHDTQSVPLFRKACHDWSKWGFTSYQTARQSLGAALRETYEEAGLSTEQLRLVCTDIRCLDHWLTPEVLKRRFDTYFWAMTLTQQLPIQVDQVEITEGRWWQPKDLITAYYEGLIDLPAPTLCLIHEFKEQIDQGKPLGDLIDDMSRAARPEPICPVLVRSPQVRLYLPGSPQYEACRTVQPQLQHRAYWQKPNHFLEQIKHPEQSDAAPRWYRMVDAP